MRTEHIATFTVHGDDGIEHYEVVRRFDPAGELYGGTMEATVRRTVPVPGRRGVKVNTIKHFDNGEDALAYALVQTGWAEAGLTAAIAVGIGTDA